MRTLLLAFTVMAFASVAASTYAQTPTAPDPLAIGGKDTAWFMDRVGRPDTDSEPQAPFKIMGNVYYIGANNIASILVATPQGHILIDTGTQKMAAVVFPNMVKLGFKPADIKLMLISHAHYDHMETMETIRRITGATVAALEAEVPALVSGHDLSSNETWGQEPLQVGRVLKSGDDITLGGSTVKVIWTPGHTPGAAAYFVTVEALTNVAKHSGASKARVRIGRRAEVLRVEIADDGDGGADADGAGLTGLRQRVEALDGRLAVQSGDFGTTIRAELPCASSSQKT